MTMTDWIKRGPGTMVSDMPDGKRQDYAPANLRGRCCTKTILRLGTFVENIKKRPEPRRKFFLFLELDRRQKRLTSGPHSHIGKKTTAAEAAYIYIYIYIY